MSIRYAVGSWATGGAVPQPAGLLDLRRTAIPEVRVPPHFDGSSASSELAGVIEDVDQHLLDLSGFEKQERVRTG